MCKSKCQCPEHVTPVKPSDHCCHPHEDRHHSTQKTCHHKKTVISCCRPQQRNRCHPEIAE